MKYIKVNGKNEISVVADFPIKKCFAVEDKENFACLKFIDNNFIVNLEKIKQDKINYIENIFMTTLKTYSFKSTIMNTDINCRRFESINDLEDLFILIKNSKRKNLNTVKFYGLKESFFTNISMLEKLYDEMIDRLDIIIEKKNKLIEDVKLANTEEDVNKINW